MSKIRATACILTKNEEDNLPKCLAPLRDFEEIIVYDSGSTDKTVEVAQKFGATVIEGAWEGFGATRKKLFEAANQPWILWIDADEVAGEDLIGEIRNCVEADPKADGYRINRISWIGGKRFRHGNWYPDWNLRLFLPIISPSTPRSVLALSSESQKPKRKEASANAAKEPVLPRTRDGRNLSAILKVASQKQRKPAPAPRRLFRPETRTRPRYVQNRPRPVSLRTQAGPRAILDITFLCENVGPHPYIIAARAGRG